MNATSEQMSTPPRHWAHGLIKQLRLIVHSFAIVLLGFIGISCGMSGYRGDSMDPRCVFARPGYTHYHVYTPAHGDQVSCRFDATLLPHDAAVTPESSPPTPAHPPTPVTRS